ncbi:MAG: hypothetical protein LBU43_10520 [Candidatus Accumulibacter sp.]|nr:hypothetical protein [Accumulibacter sp.]
MLAGLFSCAFAFAAADIDIIDRQRQEVPAPKSLPSLEIVDDRVPAELDQSLRFTLGGLRVDGASVFSDAELTGPYRESFGRETSYNRVAAIAGELTKKYRDAGYLLSRVVLPVEQGALDARDAHIRLVAIEGYISAVEYEDGGEPELAARFKTWWAAIEQKLLAMRPLKHADFEREMLLLFDLPGVQISSRFKEAGENSATGATVLVIELRHQALDLSFNAGSTGTSSAGRGIVTVGVGLNSPPFIGGHTTLSYTQAAHRKEYRSIALGHSHQFANGIIASLHWARSDSPYPDSDFARLFDYETKSETLTLGVSYPFIRSRDLNLSAGLSFEHRNSAADLLDTRYTRDRLRGLTLGLNFDFADEWGGVTQVLPSFTRGVSWFDATDRDADASTPIAPASFTRAKLHLSRNQSLPGKFSFFAAAETQYSSKALSSYHRYLLGGSQFGRGYAIGVIENDRGAAVSLEGRWNMVVAATTVQPFIFIDWGKTWSVDGHDKERLASNGIGLRLHGKAPNPITAAQPGNFSLTVFAAWARREAGDTDKGDHRYMMQGVLSF